MKVRKLQKKDIVSASLLAKETFEKYNSSDYFDKKGVQETLDIFDPKKNSEEELWNRFKDDPIFYVAEEKGKIVGMIRGRPDKISTLFVHGKRHKGGIGTTLCEKFEREAIKLGSKIIKVRASLYAAAFYQKMGYKKTTGIRNFMGLKVFNMSKKLN